MVRKVMLFGIVLILCVCTALGKEIYVGKTNCTDDGNGTEVIPFCTIQEGADTARAGDIVYVMPGNYPEDVRLYNSGTEDNYITYTPLEPKSVTLHPGSFYANGISYTILKGFVVEDPADLRAGFRIYGTGQFFELRDNELSGANMSSMGAIEIGGYMKNVTVDGNYVHHSFTGMAEAIKVFEHVDGFIITNNLVEYNSNIGIVVNGWLRWGKPNHGYIANNTVRYNSYYSPWSAGIYLDCAQNVVVEYNIAHNNIRGYQVGCEEPGEVAEYNTVRFNIAYDNTEAGMQMGGYQEGITRYNQVYNNVFFEDGVRELGFDGTPGYDNEIYNNIFFAPGHKLINGEGSENIFDHNIYYDYGGPGNYNIQANPNLTDPYAYDFRPKPSSLACTGGREGYFIGMFPCVMTCGDDVCNGGETCVTCEEDCDVCPPTCGDYVCEGDEACSNCATDCGVCPHVEVCGNNICTGTENCTNCALDCGSCPASCGDGSCNGAESCSTCASDCGACLPACGNGICVADESCNTCSADCGFCQPVCGDDACDASESCGGCPRDCGVCAPVCGDGRCNGNETMLICQSDCIKRWGGGG